VNGQNLTAVKDRVLTVTPGALDSSKTVISGQISPFSVVGAQSVIELQAADQFSNNRAVQNPTGQEFRIYFQTTTGTLYSWVCGIAPPTNPLLLSCSYISSGKYGVYFTPTVSGNYPIDVNITGGGLSSGFATIYPGALATTSSMGALSVTTAGAGDTVWYQVTSRDSNSNARSVSNAANNVAFDDSLRFQYVITHNTVAGVTCTASAVRRASPSNTYNVTVGSTL